MTPRRGLIAVGLVALPVLGGAIAAQLVADIPVRHLVVDTRTLGELPLYVGAVSYVGILGWAAASAICLFAATLLRGQAGSARTFLIRAGAVSVWLGIDDLWEVHERVLPSMAFQLFGVAKSDTESLALVATAAVVLLHLGLSLGTIRRTQWWLLAFAVICFGVMVATDVAVSEKPDDSIVLNLLEDGMKLVGILAWLAYHADTARALVRADEAHRTGGIDLEDHVAPVDPAVNPERRN